jgi:hypothetical protein
MRPKKSEYGDYFDRYIALVEETEILPVLEQQVILMRNLQNAISSEKELFAYGPGKWSIREVIGHLGDVERVFGYRAFCISRGDTSHFPSYDENSYVANAPFRSIPVAKLIADFCTVREGNLFFLKQLEEAQWQLLGTASDVPFTPRALAYVLGGHVRHHLKILKDRYGL